jgi:hypothetical protein
VPFRRPAVRDRRSWPGPILLALALVLPPSALAAAGPRVTVRADSARALTAAGRPAPASGAVCVQSHGGRRIARLRFAVPAPAGAAVDRATLRLYVERRAARAALRLGAGAARSVGRRGWLALDATTVARRGARVEVRLAAARGATCFTGRRSKAHAPRLALRYAVLPAAPVPPGPGPADAPAAPGPSPPAVVQEAQAPPAPLPPPRPADGRRLVLDDDFDGPALDVATWTPGYWTPGNAFYAPGNVLQAGGVLRLRASSPTSAAMVQTLGRVAVDRGRVEVRARTPYGQGLWPAIWLRPVDLGEPYPEVDALETWQTDAQAAPFDARTLWMNYHWHDGHGVHLQTQTRWTGPDDLTAGMHDYAVEWRPGRITWYVDGVRRARIDGPHVAATPMFLVLSLQVGAWWMGDGGYPSVKTRFPADFVIDRVRVWEDPPGG